MALTRRTLLWIAPLAARSAPAQAGSDDLLYDRVHRRLNNHPALRIRNLAVEVSNGVVTIAGIVRSDAIKRRATKVASIKGVKKVVNKLAVSA
ncbi:MAG: BON domain-containing protein [Bryobacterales bacterium]|nr:BON domain-containing protein [Bryobacterales bacterium]